MRSGCAISGLINTPIKDKGLIWIIFTFYNEPKVLKKLLTCEECDFLINHNNESLKKTSFYRSESDICDVKSLFKWISKHEDKIKSLTDRCLNLGNFTHEKLEDLKISIKRLN